MNFLDLLLSKIPLSPKDILKILFITLIWGVSFVGIKEVVYGMPPFIAAGSRFLIGGLVVWVFTYKKKPSSNGILLRKPTFKEAALIGVLQTTALYGLAFVGMRYATAGAASLLINTNPVFVVIISAIVMGIPIRLRTLFGLLAAVAGVIVVSVNGSLGSAFGIGILLAASLSWATASVVLKKMPDVDLLALSRQQMILGSIPLLLAGLVFEPLIFHLTAITIFWLLFLALPATAINFVFWFDLLNRYGTVSVTSWLFLIPVFGILSGIILLNEAAPFTLFIGAPLILAGVLAVQSGAKKQQEIGLLNQELNLDQEIVI